MADEKRYKKEIPLNGKLNTNLDPSQIGDNFSSLKNLRYEKVGVSPVGGMAKINTSVYSSTYDTPKSAIHFRKTDPAESHLLVEATSGSAHRIYDNQAAVPATGDFETTAVYTPDASSNGGRWAEAPNGMVAYANGEEACLWGGDEFQVGAFVTSTAAVVSTATDPQDYTEQLRNDLTSTGNIVSFSGASYWLVGSPLPLKGLKYYVNSANATVGVITVEEWTGSAWSALTVTDGTASGGATLAQTGSMTWSSTASTSKIRMIYGAMLYWYQFSATCTCELYRVTVDAPFQTIKDIPDGIDREIYSLLQYSGGQYVDKTIGVRANEYDSSNSATYIEIDSLSSSDYVYCGFAKRLSGLVVNVVPDHANSGGGALTVSYWDGSAFQNTTGTVDGTAGGAPGADMVTGGDCYNDEFNTGVGWAHNNSTKKYDCDGSQVADSDLDQDISMSAGVTYQVTYTLSNVSAGTITPKCGTVAGASASNDGTYSVAIVSDGASVYFTADSNFTGSIDDIVVRPLTGSTFGKSGVITWAAPGEDSEFQTEITNAVPLFYYRLEFPSGTDADTQAYYIAGVPAQKTIKNYDFPLYANDRLWLCKNNSALCSLAETANVFNGNGSVEIFFGDDKKLTGGAWLYSQYGASIYNVSLFFKQNETWAVIGSDPETWQKYRVSKTVGCPAPGTIVVADIGEPGEEKTNRSVVIWQGSRGIYISDGRQPIPISGDIADRFDPRRSTCVSQTYINQMQAFWDSEKLDYHWLMGTGASIDTELVFSFKKYAWFEIDRTTGKELQIGVSATSSVGAEYNYGFIDGGYVERLEYGTSMDSVAIPFEMQFGDIALHEGSIGVETKAEHHALICKAKTTSAQKITLTHYLDSKTSGTSWAVSMQKAGYRLIFPVTHRTAKGIFHSWKMSVSTDDESFGFEPLYFSVIYAPQRDNTRDRR